MKNARILSAGVALALLIAVQPVLAEEGWLKKLNPFAEEEKPSPAWSRTYNAKRAEPSSLEKLGASTKKFFGGARDALTWKKTPPKRRPTNQYGPWVREPNDLGYFRRQQEKEKKKRSWLDSLFRREEPKQVQSLKDWVGLPRLDP